MQLGVHVPAAHEGGTVEVPRRRSEATAAGLLGTWTDAATAMQQEERLMFAADITVHLHPVDRDRTARDG